jgi:tetratricopeptide (TPR) repeat protein
MKQRFSQGKWPNWMLALVALLMVWTGIRASADDFQSATSEYEAGRFDAAAGLFAKLAAQEPAAGTLYNLGDAEWQAGHAGPAILAWERAQWLDPWRSDAAMNLRFARRNLELDSPEPTWYEVCSTWLPVDAWPWLACGCFWLALALVMLPGIFGWRRAGWQQGVAAASFAILLLTIPALIGVHERGRIGVILPDNVTMRLTPTKEAQVISTLPAGTSARLERERGGYLLVRAGTALGWVERGQLALIAD